MGKQHIWPNAAGELRCSNCNEYKHKDNFHLATGTTRGFSYRCKICSNEDIRYNRTPEQRKIQNRKSNLKLYGITEEQLFNMRINQDFSCAICGKDEDDMERGLSKDHDHITGKVRGLLCQNCNSALGMLKENVNILKSAIRYLENHKGDNDNE